MIELVKKVTPAQKKDASEKNCNFRFIIITSESEPCLTTVLEKTLHNKFNMQNTFETYLAPSLRGFNREKQSN